MAVLRAVIPSPAAYGRAMSSWGGLSVLGATAGNLSSGVISALLSWCRTFAVPLVVALATLVLLPGPDAAEAESTAPAPPASIFLVAQQPFRGTVGRLPMSEIRFYPHGNDNMTCPQTCGVGRIGNYR